MDAGADSGEEDSKQELTDLILRPLKEDDPLRPVLKRDLELRLAHVQPEPDHLSAEKLVALLRKRPVKQKLSAAALAALASLLLLSCFLWLGYAHIPGLGIMPGAPPMLKQLALKRIFVPGSDQNFTSAQQYAEQLWRATPDDPILYFGHVLSYSSRYNALPPDYHETWSRIDPDNGMWAVCEAESILAGQHSSYMESSRDQALKMFLEAAEKPRLHFYCEEWLDRFCQHLRMPHSLPELLATHSQLIAIDPRLHLSLPTSPTILRRQLAQPDCESPIAYRRVLDWIEKESSIRTTKTLPLSWDAIIPALRTYMACWSALATACLLLAIALVMHLRKIPSRGEAGKLASCFHQFSSTRDLVATVMLAFPIPALLLLAPFGYYSGESQPPFLPLMVVPPAWLAIVTASLKYGDSQISRQTGIFGFGSSGNQRRLNTVMCVLSYLSFLPLLALWTGKIYILLATGHELSLALPAGIASAIMMITLGVKLLLGYTAPDTGIRHRIIAQRLLPGILVMVILLSTIALVLHGFERSLIHDIVNTEMSGSKSL